MPFNPHRIPKHARDAGTAERLNDVQRSLQYARRQSGVVAPGARITGALLTTNDSAPDGTGAGIYMQGPDGPNGEGVFATDDSGDVVMSLTSTGLATHDASGSPIISLANDTGLTLYESDGSTAISLTQGFGLVLEAGGQFVAGLIPGAGLVLASGDDDPFGVIWDSGQTIRAFGEVGSGSTEMKLSVPGTGSNFAVIDMRGEDGGSPASITATAGSHEATLIDGDGNTQFPGNVGFWGSAGPGIQPGQPRIDTLAHFQADVTAILGSYGLTL